MKETLNRCRENLSEIDNPGRPSLVYRCNYYNNSASIYTYTGGVEGVAGIELEHAIYGVKYVYGLPREISRLLVCIAENISVDGSTGAAEMIIDIVNFLTYSLKFRITIDDYTYIMSLLKDKAVIN